MRSLSFPFTCVAVALVAACGSGNESGSGDTNNENSTGNGSATSGGASNSGTHASSQGATSGSTGAGSTSGGVHGSSSQNGTANSAGGSSASSSGGPSDGGSGPKDGGSDAAACTTTDTCPAPNAGITFDCEKRFLFGENYAWQNWGLDFGGGSSGVAADSTTVKAALQDMQSHGSDVIRWWMFQELNGNNGVALDSNGVPTGSGQNTLVADIQAALSLAAQVGVHYNFTLFSFDNFVLQSGRHDMAPIITNDANRAKLMQFVALVAQTVEADPNKDRVVSWDVINEPEWAIGGMDGDVDAAVTGGMDSYGDPVFNGGSAGKVYDLVTFDQMQTFVQDTVNALHQNSSALVTVGSAAVKWKDSWTHVGLDYYTVHMYDWINQYYPYTASVASYGYTLPVVMGEFPNGGLTGAPFATLMSSIFSKSVGYAGAMAWAYTDPSFPWTGADGGAGNEQAFAATEPCVTKF